MKKEIQITNEAVRAAQESYLEAERLLKSLQDSCQHRIVPDDPEWLDASGRICAECGYKFFDWYCPDNPPTHACEYTHGEYCIHCGDPEERK